MSVLVEVESVIHRYGDRIALNGVSFQVEQGKLFGLIGPNGGGKSTIFRILSTLTKPTSGMVREFGVDVVAHPQRIRQRLGVVFQTPALDKKLSVQENLIHHGHLYGMRGQALETRALALLDRFGLRERKDDRVESLSGGLKRRVEIARALMHSPELLILDEPTTGLDPRARREVWDHLKALRDRDGLTVLLTTHLLDEAEECHEVAFLDEGDIVLSGNPAKLKAQMGGDIISLRTPHPDRLKREIFDTWALVADVVDHEVRLHRSAGHELIPQLVMKFQNDVESVTLSRPTLEDLFIKETGRRLAARPEVKA